MTIFHGPTHYRNMSKPEIVQSLKVHQWHPTPGRHRHLDESLVIRGAGVFRVKRIGRQGFFVYFNHDPFDGPFTTAEAAKHVAEFEAMKIIEGMNRDP